VRINADHEVASLDAVASLADHLNTWIALEKAPITLAHDRVIVDQ
jgi:hypothetical protein